VCSRRGLPM